MLGSDKFIDIETLLSDQRLLQLKNDFSVGNLTTSEIKKLSDNLLYDIFKSHRPSAFQEPLDNRIKNTY